MYLIGLTGGIGTGKSRVAALLRELGAEVISSDQLAREVVEPGQPALQEIVQRFGSEYLLPDGTLNRRLLAELVFSDEQARKDLEAIMHPRIRQLGDTRLEMLRRRENPPQVVVFEIPLLFETGREKDFDEIWVVVASEETAIKRAAKRDRSDEDHIRARMRAQMPVAEKARRAHVVIDNDGDWEETGRQVRQRWRELQQRLGDKGAEERN